MKGRTYRGMRWTGRGQCETISVGRSYRPRAACRFTRVKTRTKTMATDKKADKKAVRKAGEFALKAFPKAKIKAAIEVMAGKAGEADVASDAKAAAALDVCALAESFRDTNMTEGAPCDVIAKGWTEHLKSVALDLAVAGNRFAELKEGKEGEAATAKLTGYGNNVASIAKGVIEFEILLDAMPEGIDGVDAGAPAESYRDVRKVVEATRAAKRREADPEGAALADAKALTVEAWDALRTAVFDSGDQELILGLADTLNELKAAWDEAAEAQDVIEAEAA